MILGTVVGRVWNERQVRGLEGRRLVAVRVAGGVPIVAVDLIEVAGGNTVLLATDEAAQQAAGGTPGGIDAAVVASRSVWTSVRNSRPPPAATASAVARPMPLAAPVMNTFNPSSRRSLRGRMPTTL